MESLKRKDLTSVIDGSTEIKKHKSESSPSSNNPFEEMKKQVKNLFDSGEDAFDAQAYASATLQFLENPELRAGCAARGTAFLKGLPEETQARVNAILDEIRKKGPADAFRRSWTDTEVLVLLKLREAVYGARDRKQLMTPMKRKDTPPTSIIDGSTEIKKHKSESSPDKYANNDPFEEMIKHLKILFTSRKYEFDVEAYISASQQVLENPELQARSAFSKGLPEETHTRINAILDEIRKEGPDAFKRCYTDPKVLLKFWEAINVDNSCLSESDGREESEDDSEDEYDEPLIHTAAIKGNLEVLMKEISRGAKLEEADQYGLTALHWACWKGEYKCARALIKAEVNVNILDKDDNTPLHYAAHNGSKDCVHLLLSWDADDTLRNIAGRSAKDLAEIKNYMDIVELIDRCGSLSTR